MPSWKKQFWELHHQHTWLCLLHPLPVPLNSCPLLTLIWPTFLPFFSCFCVEWAHLFTTVRALSSCSFFGAIYCCMYQNPLIYWTDMCCLLQHCCLVPQMLCFTFSLQWSVNSSGWRSFPSDVIFIGCRETGADGIDTSPRPARMTLSRQSGQMLMKGNGTRFVVCWCSVRILPKCMSVMPWQEVFAWDGQSRKMRKAGHEREKNGEADSSSSMKRSCLGVNDSERTPVPGTVHEESRWFQQDGRNVGENSGRFAPCFRPHGMTEKAELLWTLADTPHIGALLISCMKKTLMGVSSRISGH